MILWLLPLAKLALHLCTTGGYGIFRDELYYIACSEHLSAGYVDHPGFSIWVLWAVRHLLGDSLFALRLLPAICGALTVYVVGRTARVLGGGTFAQTLAMTAALIAPEYLGLNHYYSMNSFDLLAWSLVGYLVARLQQESLPRLWILLGLVCGFGLWNKIGLLWLGAGLVVGLLATPARRALLTVWPWVTALMAVFGLDAYLRWQVANDWSTVEWMQNATSEKMVHGTFGSFVHGQIDAMHPLNVLIWGAGVLYLLFHREARQFRILGWMWLTVAVILATAEASRAGYLAPAYTFVFAAGGVAWERILVRRQAALRYAFVGLWLLAGAAVAPLAMPLLPLDSYVRYAAALGQKPDTEEKKELADLPQWYADMQGWSLVADAMARAFDTLPAEERRHAAVFGGDYGVAGAIDFFGPALGLPKAVSGHNSYWLWGPRDWDGSVAIIPTRNEGRLRYLFGEVQRVGTIECGRCMPYENHLPIWIVRRARVSVPQLWFAAKHFD